VYKLVWNSEVGTENLSSQMVAFDIAKTHAGLLHVDRHIQWFVAFYKYSL